MLAIPLETCKACGSSHEHLRRALEVYTEHLDAVRREPWQDYEFAFHCRCGHELDETDFFLDSWSHEALRDAVLQFALAHSDLFRDDSWSYGSWALPGSEELARLDEQRFSIYLQIVGNTDFDHAHDDLYAIHETWLELRKTAPERAERMHKILTEAGSQVVAELLS